MNLEKVNLYQTKISGLTNKIEKSKSRIEVLKDLDNIYLKGGKKVAYDSTRITPDHEYFNMDIQSVEVFKTLAIKELEAIIKETEKELAEVIKKGIEE